jgi:hypothetical protein
MATTEIAFSAEYARLPPIFNQEISKQETLGNLIDTSYSKNGKWGWKVDKQEIVRPRCVFETDSDNILKDMPNWGVFNATKVIQRLIKKNPDRLVPYTDEFGITTMAPRKTMDQWNLDFYNPGLCVIKRRYNQKAFGMDGSKPSEGNNVIDTDYPAVNKYHIWGSIPVNAMKPYSYGDVDLYYTKKKAADAQGVPPTDPNYPKYPTNTPVKRFKRTLLGEVAGPAEAGTICSEWAKKVYPIWSNDLTEIYYGVEDKTIDYVRLLTNDWHWEWDNTNTGFSWHGDWYEDLIDHTIYCSQESVITGFSGCTIDNSGEFISILIPGGAGYAIDFGVWPNYYPYPLGTINEIKVYYFRQAVGPNKPTPSPPDDGGGYG